MFRSSKACMRDQNAFEGCVRTRTHVPLACNLSNTNHITTTITTSSMLVPCYDHKISIYSMQVSCYLHTITPSNMLVQCYYHTITTCDMLPYDHPQYHASTMLYASVPDWKHSIFTATGQVASQFESSNSIEVCYVPVI